MTAAALAPVLFQPDGNEEGGFIQLLTHPFQTIHNTLHPSKDHSVEDQELEIVLFAEDFGLAKIFSNTTETYTDFQPNIESILEELPELDQESTNHVFASDDLEVVEDNPPSHSSFIFTDELDNLTLEETNEQYPEVVDIYISELATFLYYEYRYRVTSLLRGIGKPVNRMVSDRYYTFKERCHSSHDYKVRAIITSCMIVVFVVVFTVCAMWPQPANAKLSLPLLKFNELNSAAVSDFKEVLGDDKIVTIHNPNYPTSTVAYTPSGVVVSQTPISGNTHVDIYVVHNGITTISGKLYDFSSQGEFAPLSRFEYECYGKSPIRGDVVTISYYKPGTQQVLTCNAKPVLINDKQSDLGYGLEHRLLVQMGKIPPTPLSPLAADIKNYPNDTNQSAYPQTRQKKD
jgi:hypothetical protein